jgi:hypothetical protein
MEQQQQQPQAVTVHRNDGAVETDTKDKPDDDDTMLLANLTLQDITEPITITTTTSGSSNNTQQQQQQIPKVRFIEDITQYVQSFPSPYIVTAELLIGAFTQLHTKYKLSETSLLRKRTL